MNGKTTISTPQSVAEVEELVKRLYKPGPANLITQINDELLRIQLSPDGWKLADELMASDDANVRFYAALTFTIKLNNDGSVFDPELSAPWPSLDAETAKSVLMRLISWLVRLVQRGEGGLVCKKLCSTLTTYFIRSAIPWKKPLLHLAMSFSAGDALPESAVEDTNSTCPMSDILPSLTTLQLKALLWFSMNLAEEVGKADPNVQSNARFHAEMERTVVHASALMSWSFRDSDTDKGFSSPRKETLQTFLTWINYAQPIWPRNPDALSHLRNLIHWAAQCLSDETLFADALDIFRDILESYTSFFQAQHMEMLAKVIYNHVGPSLGRALAEQDSSDILPLAQFVIAFGCANIQQVVEQPSNELGSATIVRLHLDILQTAGYPGDEDQLSTQSIEFWNTYIEYVNDTLFSKDPDEPDPPWLVQSRYVLEQAIELIWKKMWTPTPEIAKTWHEAESEGFKEFRLDASDLMLSVFLVRTKSMLQQLVTLTLGALEAQQWRAVEAGLFCLNTLAENILEDMAMEQIVGEVFRSSLFREIADFSQNIPSQARRSTIEMLGSYSQYIERHAEFLPDTLRFLFASLETAGFANNAAKAIASLCYSCRASLTNELDGFLAQYQRFLASTTSEPYTKEKVIGAIAAIIQAMTPESAKPRPLFALLENVEQDISAAEKYAAAGDEEMSELMGVTALECLASIGKGMQVPEDIPIDIYDDDEPEETSKTNHWESEQGQAIRKRIVGCFSVLRIVGKYSAAVDAACQVLRSGYTETEPGPFVLPASVTVNFLQQCSVQTPQLEAVLSTTGVLVTQHSRQDSKRIEEEVLAICGCVSSFIQTLGQSRNDPAVAMGCIDVLNRMLPGYAPIVFRQLTPAIINFTLSAIDGPDTLPKRSACDFWSKLLKPQAAAVSSEVHQRIDQIVDAHGSEFADCLMRQLGGQAQRSDLEFLCDSLKSLILSQRKAQTWLQAGLSSANFPSSNVSEEDKMKFLRQLLSLRSDGKKIKDLARVFWAACRGTVVSYSS